MEDRTLQPNQLPEGPTAIAEPQAPSDGDDAPAALFFSDDDESESESDGEGEEFEFPFVSRDSPAGTAAPADELFADGRIRPFYYPVFGHGGTAGQPAAPATTAPPRVRGQLGRLFLEESRARNSSIGSTASTASTSSDGGGLEGAPPESYCLWTPGSSASSSPRPPRKSGSTGSMARWRRISELVVGRSHSDGKEKFMFFPAPQPKEAVKLNNKHHHDKPKPGPASGVTRKQAPAEVVDTVAAAHRIGMAYGGVVPGGTPRRTFLPYREELVGFFANVNGISRSHQHPF